MTRAALAKARDALAAVALTDIKDLFGHDGRPAPVRHLDPVSRSAVAAVSIGRVNGPAGVVSEKFHVRFWDKLRALELLARHLGLDRPPPPLGAVLDTLPDHVRAKVVAALSAPPA